MKQSLAFKIGSAFESSDPLDNFEHSHLFSIKIKCQIFFNNLK